MSPPRPGFGCYWSFAKVNSAQTENLNLEQMFCLLSVEREGKHTLRTFLAVQWLRLSASTAGGTGLIPSWGTKILHPMQGEKKKENTLLVIGFLLIFLTCHILNLQLNLACRVDWAVERARILDLYSSFWGQPPVTWGEIASPLWALYHWTEDANMIPNPV